MNENTDTDCEAVRDRRRLTAQILRATCVSDEAYHRFYPEPPDGSEGQLLLAFGILQGIVNEYQDGGDQMVETCTCGQHIKWKSNITDVGPDA